MPVLTCGGMRYQQSWDDDEKARASVTDENQKNLEATIRYALELGINHIETARGYGTSEFQLGKLLPTLPRDEMIVQTKVGPKDTPAEFLEAFETSYSLLGLEYIDLLSIHGVNSAETLEQAKKCYPALEQLKKEGRIGHVGFSTHAPSALAVEAINTGLFEYVNLHWYFVYHPINRAPVDAAAALDMGVFIISPCNKGGMLYQPPPKLIDLCQPLTPMAFNDLYCLRDPNVHTLSIGAARPSDFTEHVVTVQGLDTVNGESEKGAPLCNRVPMVGPERSERGLADSSARQRLKEVAKIEERIFQCLEKELGAKWVHHWHEGLPRQVDTPGGINIPEILRLWTYAKGLDMVEFGKLRYNLLGGAGGHWFPGEKAIQVDEEALKPLLENSPFAEEIPGILRDAHKLLNAEDLKRLSES